MTDDFNRALWALATDSPTLRQALASHISKTSAGYSIPTGDIHLQVYANGTPSDKLISAIKKADSMTVGQLGKILAELRAVLEIRQIQGETLQPFEETLKDIDISCLATFALVEWAKHAPHTEG